MAEWLRLGSVYKLSGKRRKPFIARKTIGWEDDGKQIYQTIGYYEKRQDALNALADFNQNPYSIDVATVTFSEIFEKWSKDKFSKISASNVNGYKASYKIAESLHDMKFVEIKKPHMQAVIDNCELGHGSLKKIKVLFNQLFKYALENDIINKDYSKFVEIGENEKESTRKPFTQKEIRLLWDNVGRMDFIDTVLIMIYTGMRPGELILIKNEDVNLEERIVTGGIKTKASKNRIIPINEKILPLIKNRLSENEFFIVNHEGNQMRYWNYYEEKWKKIMEQLGMKHKPHDCRHTFATLMDNAGANKVSVKRIMGHASKDITDRVYTHKDIEELLKAVDMI
ncbi:MAG: integrase [Peptococcaceae bacterium BICA1-8]|nr:MAG: integrase [Peptococcaceae bacterium BICA1-8]